jgi:tetratricopeptide (TPR) repeat protein
MKNILLLFILFSLEITSQTKNPAKGTYTVQDEVMSITDGAKDVLEGYPDASLFDNAAIDYYNKATNIIYSDANLAAEYYLKAIKIEPKFVQAIDNLGKVYRILEKYDLAEKYYKKSIEIFPNGSTSHQNLAVVYDRQGRYNKEVDEYKKVIEINSKDPEGYFGLAKTYLYRTSEIDLALKNALKALELYKKNPPNYIGDGYQLVGLIYYYSGDEINAKKYIQIAKEKHIENDLEDAFTVDESILTKLSIK